MSETSTQRSAPVYLFRIDIGDEIFRYTSAIRDVEIAGDKWLASPIVAGKIKLTDKVQQDEFTLSMPFEHELPQKLMSRLMKQAAITVFSVQLEDVPPVLTIEFTGADAFVSPEDRENCTIAFSSLFRISRNGGSFPVFSKRCRHAIYSAGCGLKMEDHETTVTISAINGKLVTVGAIAANQYNRGILKAPDGTLHYIYSQNGNTLMLFDSYVGLAVSDVVQIYHGCDQSYKRCTELNNVQNFGGDPWLGENLFDGRFLR